MSDPEFNPDRELSDLMNGNLPSPPLSHEEMLGLAEFMQEENLRLRRILPVLDNRELVPGNVDMQALDHDRVMELLFSDDREQNDFAFRISKLSIALHAADSFTQEEHGEYERAVVIDEIKDQVGQILMQNTSGKEWLLAAHEVLRGMLPISTEKHMLAFEVDQLIKHWETREIAQQNEYPSVASIRKHLTVEIVRKFGEHDEVIDIVRSIIGIAITQYAVPEEHVFSAEELHEKIMSGRVMQIDALSLERLVYTVKKAIRRS